MPEGPRHDHSRVDSGEGPGTAWSIVIRAVPWRLMALWGLLHGVLGAASWLLMAVSLPFSWQAQGSRMALNVRCQNDAS